MPSQRITSLLRNGQPHVPADLEAAHLCIILPDSCMLRSCNMMSDRAILCIQEDISLSKHLLK